jgi:HEAT repeat protein
MPTFMAFRPTASPGSPRLTTLLLVLALVWLPLEGCGKPTSENIQLWKTTEKGPGKLIGALGDRSTDPAMRAEAAVALLEIGKADEVDAALAGMPANERWEVFKILLPLYMKSMTDSKDSAPEKAMVFRDALFSTRALAQPEDRTRIDEALMPGIEQELRAGKVRNGRHSVEKILTAIGSSSGGMLSRLLGEPITGYPAVADLLNRVGDEQARMKGAQNLVARAHRERPVPEVMWRAIGVLGGPVAVKFLEDKVSTGSHDEAAAAVRALQQRRDPAVLPFAMKIAADTKADRTIRDEMFGVVETIGGLEARDGLVRIIQGDKEELARYRAFESLLAVSKQDGVLAGLEAFPASSTYKKVDVEDLMVKLIEKLGPPARPVLVKALESKYPLARMTAVMSLESLGKAADAPALDKLAKDSTLIKGFPATETIGKEAERIAALVRSRR